MTFSPMPSIPTDVGKFHDPSAGQSGFDPQDQTNGLPGPNDPRWHLSVILGSMLGDRTLANAQQTSSLPQPSGAPAPPDFAAGTNQKTPEAPAFGLDELRQKVHAGEPIDTTTHTTTTQATGATSTSGDSIITDANKYLGIKYVYGGTDPNTGLDCSGFVQRVFADLGVALPRVTYDQVKVGQTITDPNALRAGDLIFLWGDGNRENGHVGIYVGGGVMIDAPHTGANVRYDKVNWGRVTAMRRVT